MGTEVAAQIATVRSGAHQSVTGCMTQEGNAQANQKIEDMTWEQSKLIRTVDYNFSIPLIKVVWPASCVPLRKPCGETHQE